MYIDTRIAEPKSQEVGGFRVEDFLSDSGSPIKTFFTSHSWVRNPNSCL